MLLLGIITVKQNCSWNNSHEDCSLTKRRRVDWPDKVSQRVVRRCMKWATRRRTFCPLHAPTDHCPWPVI